MFQLALAFEARIERLSVASFARAVGFQHVPAALGQHDRMIAVAGDANRLDQALFAQVSEVTVTWIQRAIRVVAQVAGGDDPEGTHGGKGAALGAAQRVLAVARVVDDLAVATAWQIEISREDVAGVGATLKPIALSL